MDNKVGELADWDFDVLNIELDGISDIDMSEFGFQCEDLAEYEPLDLDDNTITKSDRIHKCPKCGFEFGDDK